MVRVHSGSESMSLVSLIICLQVPEYLKGRGDKTGFPPQLCLFLKAIHTQAIFFRVYESLRNKLVVMC